MITYAQTNGILLHLLLSTLERESVRGSGRGLGLINVHRSRASAFKRHFLNRFLSMIGDRRRTSRCRQSASY